MVGGASNRGCNGYYPSKKQRVLQAVLDSSIELAPVQIAKATSLNRQTVKGYLRQLLREGKILQPYPGYYCSEVTHGMIVAPLRVQNVIVTSYVSWLGFSDDVVEFVGGVKVRVQFGLERRKITGRISCEEGMDRNSVLFALNRFYDMVRARCGRDIDEVTLKTFEVNRDYQGVRLDGAKCYTKKGLFGAIEKLYQKEDAVRHEVKVTQEMTVDSFMALIQGGVGTYNLQQGQFALVSEVRKLVDAVKGNNWQVLKLTQAVEKVLKLLKELKHG